MNRRLRGLLGLLFIIAAFAFLAAAILRHREQLLSYPWAVRPLRLAASWVVLLSALVLSAQIWRHVLRLFDVHIGLRPAARLWFLSSLGRYIPGKIWQFVGVAELGRQHDVPAIVAVSSLVAYMWYVVLSALMVGVYTIPPEAVSSTAPALEVARWVAAPLVAALLHPRISAAAAELVGRLSKRPFAGWEGGWSASLKLFALTTVQWCVFGLAFHLFVGALVEAPWSRLWELTGMFALSFLAGYLAVVAPAGLGIREGALGLLLASVYPLSVAAALAVAARVWNMMAEAVPALLLIPRARPGSRSGATERTTDPYRGPDPP